MVSKTQAGTLAEVSIVLAASSAALAQYSASDPRSNIYNNESLRRQDEIRRNEEAAKTQRQYDDGRSSANSRPASSSYDPRGAAELQALRAKLLRMSPLPDERNTLLGRWRVESTGKPKRKDELGQLMGMLANPGGAACQFTFGDGIIEFKSKTWASIDGHGDDSLGPIAYRADGKRLFALPAKGIEIMGFDVVSPNRIEVFNLAGCALTRVTGHHDDDTKRRAGPRGISIGRRCAATGARPGEVLNGAASGRCCACAATVNAVAPVTRGLPQHAP